MPSTRSRSGSSASKSCRASQASPPTATTSLVRDPLGRPVEAAYLLLDDGTAVVEMAAASGLPLLAAHERDPLRASTHGTGDLIAAALQAGARRLVIGVGGSATVDGGAGMAEALGARLLDEAGHPLPPGGGPLLRLAHVDLAGRHPGLRDVEIDVLCDVQNPLTGPTGGPYPVRPAGSTAGSRRRCSPRSATGYRRPN